MTTYETPRLIAYGKIADLIQLSPVRAPYVPPVAKYFRHGIFSPHAPYGEGHRVQTDNGRRDRWTDGAMSCYAFRTWRFWHRLFRIRIKANELKRPRGRNSFVRSR